MNKQIINSILLFSLYFFTCISNAADADDILIKTVDENNKTLQAQIFKWWFSDDPDEKNILPCDQDSCSEWVIKDDINSPITVYAHFAQVKSNDEYCWDWYEGKAGIQNHQKVTTLTLSYTETVCK